MILHVDMDAFYAAVEQRDNPKLKGLPVIVGGPSTGRGVVCAASYEAREYGVHSAMPTSRAERLCPHAVFLPARMDHYAKISAEIREVFQRYTPLVEPLSLDEAFLDVTGSLRLFKANEAEIGQRIQRNIRDELGLVASVGVAPNKFLAKIASDLEKPAGFVVVPEGGVQGFLDPLPLSRIWGIGAVTGVAFDRLGIRTIGQLRTLGLDSLQAQFGDFGAHVWKLAHGVDDRSVVPDRAAKSLSHETTLATDTDDPDVIRAWLLELSDQVGRRLRRTERMGKTINLKLKFFDFRLTTRAKTLPNPTNLTREIYDAVLELYEQRVTRKCPVRLIGVGVAGFAVDDSSRQTMLFEETAHRRAEKTDMAADAIRDRFGHQALSRGSQMLHRTKHRPMPRVEKEDKKPPCD